MFFLQAYVYSNSVPASFAMPSSRYPRVCCAEGFKEKRCGRCTYSVLYGLLLADRLKLSNERLESIHTYHTSYTSPCLQPSAQYPSSKGSAALQLQCSSKGTLSTFHTFYTVQNVSTSRHVYHITLTREERGFKTKAIFLFTGIRLLISLSEVGTC